LQGSIAKSGFPPSPLRSRQLPTIPPAAAVGEAAELKQRFSTPSVLVIGAGIGGPGTDALVGDPAIRVVNSDLNPSNPTYVNADAHALPFPECSFASMRGISY
jgi:hypothetical protein